MDIYYANQQANFYGLLADIEPVKLFADLNKNSDINGKYLQCPAAAKFLNRTYVIKCPVDAEFVYHSEYNTYGLKNAPNDLQAAFTYEVLEDKFIQLGIVEYTLFSEKSVNALILPPFLHNSKVNSYNVLPAEYDISKWYRGMHLSFATEKKEPVVFLRNQPLFYITFDTDENINLKKYRYTETLKECANNCTDYKFIEPNKNLSYLYKLFQTKRYNKIILKEIKANLL